MNIYIYHKGWGPCGVDVLLKLQAQLGDVDARAAC